MTTGDYHTVAENNIFGYLVSQVTTGNSFNYVMKDGSYTKQCRLLHYYRYRNRRLRHRKRDSKLTALRQSPIRITIL